jgi:hypothetical protein
VRDGVPPTAGAVQDSDDDGFPDYLVVPGFAFSDKNSDADWDGCSDYSEMHQPVGAPCGGLNVLNPNSAPFVACKVLIDVGGLINLTGGGSVSYSSTTLADSNLSLVPDALAGMQVTAAGSYGIVASNTSTQMTLTTSWSQSVPPAGTGYEIGPCVDGNKDLDGNGVPDWKDGATDPSQQDNAINPNGGSPDSDGDGCTNRREALPARPIANGGDRDAMDTWDFYDVLTNNTDYLSRNRVVSIADTIAIMPYVGVSVANPNHLNSNGKSYAGLTAEGSPSFEIFDRSASLFTDKTGPPNGAVTIGDALLSLNQVGANCSLP